MNYPKYLFFDFDGTVHNHYRYADETMEAMRFAQEQGCQLILNTGRSQGFFEADPLAVKCPVKWDARIYGMSDILIDGRALIRHYMKPKDVWRWIWYARRAGFEIRIEGQKRNCVFRFQNPEERDFQTVRSRLRQYLREDRATKLTPIATYDAKNAPKGDWGLIVQPAIWYEVVEKGRDKGTAILDFCRLVGADPSECACFGDSSNDIEMFRVCATGICMKGSPEELKKVSTYCATGENGVAEGIAWIFGTEFGKSTKRA